MFVRSLIRASALALLSLVVACASAPPSTLPTTVIAPVANHKTVVVAPLDYGHPYVVQAKPPLQCVPFARQESGVAIYGDANLWWAKAAGHYARGTTPEPGSVMVLKGYHTDKRGHVAVVRRIVDDRTLIIDHANWLGRGEISRDVPVRDVSAANDWSEVRVWNIAGTRWGARINTVQGFIYHSQAVASR